MLIKFGDRSAEDAYSVLAPDPAFAFVGGLFCPTLDFVIAFWTMVTFYTLLTLLFCIYNVSIIPQPSPRVEQEINTPYATSSFDDFVVKERVFDLR